jgi:hypothetical protein
MVVRYWDTQNSDETNVLSLLVVYEKENGAYVVRKKLPEDQDMGYYCDIFQIPPGKNTPGWLQDTSNYGGPGVSKGLYGFTKDGALEKLLDVGGWYGTSSAIDLDHDGDPEIIHKVRQIFEENKVMIHYYLTEVYQWNNSRFEKAGQFITIEDAQAGDN